MLKAIRAPKLVRRTVRKLIPMWATDILAQTEDGTAKLPVAFERGLFQGDSLSPLLFCLSVAPLSWEMRKRKGFKSIHGPHPITHLMFVDDLKLYEESREELEESIRKAEEVSELVGMRLGLKKCAVAHATAGRVVGGGPAKLDSGAVIAKIAGEETYRYLGIPQLLLPDSEKAREKVKKEYLGRVRATWATNLNGRDKARMHNTWAVAVLRYYLERLSGDR